MAGRKFGKRGERNEKRTGAGLREEGPNSQDQRWGGGVAGPPSRRNGRLETPKVEKRRALDPQGGRRKTESPNSRGREEEGTGSQDPREVGARPTSRLGPRGAERGRILAGRAAPPQVYLSPVPGAASFPILRSRSLLTLPRRHLRSHSPGYGSVAATPPCPGPSLRSPRLRSSLPPSFFSRGRRRLSVPQPWSE